jgi:hypothetical protein
VLTRALHWSLFWARSSQSILPNSLSLRFILALPSYLRGLPSGLFPSGFPTKILYAFLFSCPSHPPWLDNSNYTWRTIQVMKLLIMQLYPTCFSLTNWLNRTVPQSRNFQHFEGSFPCSQEPPLVFILDHMNSVHTSLSFFCKIYSVLLSTAFSSKRSHLFRFSYQNFVCISLLLHPRCMSCLSHFIWSS